MQEKIEKMMSFFKDIRNEPYYTSCAMQISEIYESSPESLKFILYNLNSLIFNSCKQPRLRLKHRQVCASILASMAKIYTKRAHRFISDEGSFELESFQLDSCKPQVPNKHIHWTEIDPFTFIQSQPLLLASNKGHNEAEVQNREEEQNKIFEEYIDMKHATMLNLGHLFKDIDESETVNVAYEQNMKKFQERMEKLKSHKEEQAALVVQVCISNPFNLIYDICIENILSPEWELRHLSVLLLRELLNAPELLCFSTNVQLSRSSLEASFGNLIANTKEALAAYYRDKDSKCSIMQIVASKCFIVLCLDRFADYQSDESLMIVRVVAAEILAKAFATFEKEEQVRLLKTIKSIFDREDTNPNSKFTWEVKNSFLYLLLLLTEQKSFLPTLFKYFEESMIKMLCRNQIDEIILCICKIFSRFVGEPFFKGSAIDRVNEQIWMIVETLDDISVSTRDAFKLLSQMFPNFKLEPTVSLQRIQKFFTSKIAEVRYELYSMMEKLYSRKETISPERSKIVEQNLLQLLQAATIEGDEAIFNKLIELGAALFHYVKKFNFMRKVIEFVRNSVNSYKMTREMIAEAFKTYQGVEGILENGNQYLYIYEEDHVSVSRRVYAFKRLWKISMVLGSALKANLDCIEDFIRGINGAKEKDDRLKVLLFMVLSNLAQQSSTHKFIESMIPTAKQIPQSINQWSLTDGYISALEKELQAEIESYKVQGLAHHSEMPVTVTTEAEFVGLHKLLANLLNESSQKVVQGCRKIRSLLWELRESKHELFSVTRLHAILFALRVSKGNDIPIALKEIVRALIEAIKTDKYSFMSLRASEILLHLHSTLTNTKKTNTLLKVNEDIIGEVAARYSKNPEQDRYSEKSGTYCVEGSYMQAINEYIQKVGVVFPEWLTKFTSFFVEDYKLETEGFHRKLFLLSGTITSLLKIDHQGDFVKILSAKLGPLLNSLVSHPEASHPENMKFVDNILFQAILQLSSKHRPGTQTITVWFLERMKDECKFVFSVIKRVSTENLSTFAPLCCVFILHVVQAISSQKVSSLAMDCLSNVIVGVYINCNHFNFSPTLTKVAADGKDFVRNFKESVKFTYEIEVELHQDIQLRAYQREGVAWLGFLTKYSLGGALCDDMGLGKTLQMLILIENEYLRTPSALMRGASMIVVPVTLVEHWAFEYKKYFPKQQLRVVTIPCKRSIKVEPLNNLKQPVLYIVSYTVLEKNIEDFENMNLDFLILDEGHTIKNIKTNKFKAVKRLKGRNRFLLTGTPIQNKLKELWGLFDFLMPGYLYTLQQFSQHYESLFHVNLTTFQEDQLLFSDIQRKALEKLHLKVMPFILRRTKSEVLKELPDKIISDYLCELSPEQIELYRSFDEQVIQKRGQLKEEKFVITSLIEMQKILNHPNLIQGNAPYSASGKMISLHQIFCTLGLDEDDTRVQENKVIIFSRFSQTIDLLEEIFMKKCFPKIRYLKLTGKTALSDRFTVAQTFNSDVGIKVLLITTQVGGVGLNLTGANVVIMFDHDYNPTVDMQAIDRAHRIGQRRILNVYRLITKGTLQDRIMGIQQFKTNLAQAIVNIDNASTKNVQNSRLPELFENIRDLQVASTENENKIASSFFQQAVAEMERNAIETDQFNKKY